jgi:hypothetical protein
MSLSVDGAKAIVGLRPSEESPMKSANASELDRKSGVRLAERGAPVDSFRYSYDTDCCGTRFKVDSHADTQSASPMN